MMGKIDVSRFDRVIAYGCSYTAGDELRDHEILGMTFRQCQNMKKTLGFHQFQAQKAKKSKMTFGCMIRTYGDKNREASWAAYLSRRLNKEFINRAKGGSSLDIIFLKIIEDHINGVLTKNDLVLVGITSPNRRPIWSERPPRTYLIGTKEFFRPPEDVLKWNLIHLWTDDGNLFEWIKTLYSMASLDLNIFFQPMRGHCDPTTVHFKADFPHLYPPNQYFIDFTWKNIYKKILLPGNYLGYSSSIGHCGFGHPPEASHVNLANEIFEARFQ